METYEFVLKISAELLCIFSVFCYSSTSEEFSEQQSHKLSVCFEILVAIYVIRNFITSTSCLAVLTKKLHDACKYSCFVQSLVRSSSIFHFVINCFDLLLLLFLNC